MFTKLLKIFLLILISTNLYSQELEKIHLTDEEKNFIKNNPIIKIGSGISFEPFIMKNENSEIIGYDRDIANIIEKKTGLKIDFVLDNWSKIQKVSQNRELQGLSSVGVINKERKKYYNVTNSYLKYTPIAIVNRGNPKKIYTKNDAQGKKVAVQKDNKIFMNLAKSIKDVEIVYYNTIQEVLKAVVENEVDFTILDESVFYVANKMGISDFIMTSFILGKESQIFFLLDNSKPLLTSIFNKALNSINEYQRKEIKNKWFNIIDTHKINFSNEEKEYLYSKNHINICIDPNWYPLEKNDNGKHIGISADILKSFSKEIKIPFKLITTNNWSESLEYVKNRKCDILPLAMETENRKLFLDFTKVYISMPLVITTKKQNPFISDLKNLKKQKVSIIKNHAFIEIIKEKYKNLTIIEVENIQEGLTKVKNGEVYGFINVLANMSYELQKSFFDDLKITGSFDEKWNFSVATRKDIPILHSIFQKLVLNIKKDDIQEILNKHISVKYEKGTDYSLIFKIIFISILIFITLIIWVRKVRKEKEKINDLNKKLEIANKELEKLSITDVLTKIFNRRKIDTLLTNEIHRTQRTKEVFSIIMLDIDYFKKVNDNYGHQVGDDILYSFATLLKANIRKIDSLGRWGGEEFLIILPNTKEIDAKNKAELIRREIELYNFKIVGKKTASIGVTTYKDEDTIESITKRVDLALYKAKESGRNKVVVE